eukprot:m.121470 g.121470  ORF g.121470 m.121470 type:complete len:251 (+) comp9299_c0_seq4:2970-3722(+)
MVSIRRNEDRMQHLINSLQAKADLSSAGEDAVALQTRVYDTELALAAVKLQLAETESQCQLLAQQLQAATAREDSKKQGAGAAASIATWFRRKAPSAGTDKDREKEVGSQRDLKPTTPTPPQHASPQSDRVSAIASPPAIFEPVSSPLASGDAVVSPPTIADAWYAGSLSKTDAEARMQCQPVGAFVVSEAGAGLLLSVRYSTFCLSVTLRPPSCGRAMLPSSTWLMISCAGVHVHKCKTLKHLQRGSVA